MNAAHVKRHSAHVILSQLGANDVNKVQRAQLLHQVPGEKFFSLLDLCHVQAVKVFDSGAGSIDTSGVLRACLKLLGNRSPNSAGLGDGINHLAAGKKRWHDIKQLSATPEHANAHWSAYLVCRESQQVAVKIVHVNRDMGCGLRSVDNHVGTHSVSAFGNGFDVIAGAQHVGDVCDRHNLCALGNL